MTRNNRELVKENFWGKDILQRMRERTNNTQLRKESITWKLQLKEFPRIQHRKVKRQETWKRCWDIEYRMQGLLWYYVVISIYLVFIPGCWYRVSQTFVIFWGTGTSFVIIFDLNHPVPDTRVSKTWNLLVMRVFLNVNETTGGKEPLPQQLQDGGCLPARPTTWLQVGTFSSTPDLQRGDRVKDWKNHQSLMILSIMSILWKLPKNL